MALPEPVLHHLERLRNAAFDEARAQAVSALGGHPEHAAELLADLVKALGDPGPVVLVAAAETLGTFGEDAVPAIPHLQRHLDHANPAVRDAVARALQRLGA